MFDLVRFSEGLDKFKLHGQSASAANGKNVPSLKNRLVSRSMGLMSYVVDPSAPDAGSRELHLSGSLPGLVQHKGRPVV